MANSLLKILLEIFGSDKVGLTDAQIRAIFCGWLEGLRDEFIALFIDLGRALAVELEQGGRSLPTHYRT